MIVTFSSSCKSDRSAPVEPLCHLSIKPDRTPPPPLNLPAERYLAWSSNLRMTPISCPSNQNVFVTHFSGKRPFSGPITKLSVILIGNEETPDVSLYSPTVSYVRFIGHLSFTKPAFEIIQKLPEVTRVSFVIGKTQLTIFKDYVEDGNWDKIEGGTPVSPHVKELEIIIDFETYYRVPLCCKGRCNKKCYDLLKSTLDNLEEMLFHRAKKAFPNLKVLCTKLPETDITTAGIGSLINSTGCSWLT